MAHTIEATEILDIRDVIARVGELREQRTERWVAGWNMPGYLPDSEPVEFESALEAREYIEHALRDLSDEESEEMADELREWARAVANGSGELGVTLNGYHYFVTLDGVQGLDADEREELESLESLLSDLSGYGGDEEWNGDWYPLTLIRDDHFTDYARELVEDIGDLPNGLPSYLEIDWEATAQNIRSDYSDVEFQGHTYWYRQEGRNPR